MAYDNNDAKKDLELLKTQFGIDTELYIPEEEQACCRHKHREPQEYDALLKRLSRIEGQVRGVRGMVEKEAYCTDILTQVSAIQSALNAFSRELLANHIRTCVTEGIQSGDTEVVDELVRTVEKLMK